MNNSCISSFLQIGCCSMPIMSCATRRSRSSTEYPFLVKSNCRWSIKKYFWYAAWRSWRFPNFPNVPDTYKIIQLCLYDRHKTEYKSLTMKLRSWIKDSTFYQIRKEIYPPRKIKFSKPRPKCFYSLVSDWYSTQKAVTVFSEKYLKFFTINVCTQVRSQCIWCSAKICNGFKISINMEHIKWAICFICSSFYCFLLTHWYTFRINIDECFSHISFEILTPSFKDMILSVQDNTKLQWLTKVARMLSCTYERYLELPFSSLSFSGFVFQNQQNVFRSSSMFLSIQ